MQPTIKTALIAFAAIFSYRFRSKFANIVWGSRTTRSVFRQASSRRISPVCVWGMRSPPR